MAIGSHYIYQENKPVEADSDGASAAATSGDDNSITNSEPSVKDVSSAYLSIAELYMTDLWWVDVFSPRFKYRLEKLGESVLSYHPVWPNRVVLVPIDEIIEGSESNHYSAHLANYGARAPVQVKNVFTHMI